MTNGEVREIAWHAVSPKEQAHQMCRYCSQRATHMRMQGRQGWVPLCEEHARRILDTQPTPDRGEEERA